MHRTVLGRTGRVMCHARALFAASLLAPLPAFAGQIYGQITANGRSVPAGVQVTLACGGSPLGGRTDRFGSYQVFVPRRGRCEITIHYGGARLTAGVVSYADPVRYNFDILQRGGERRLIRR